MKKKEGSSHFTDPDIAYSLLDENRVETVRAFWEDLEKAFIIPILMGNPHLALKIFIDGVSAAGKGTILEILETYNVNTTSIGTIARAVTKYAIEHGFSPPAPGEKYDSESFKKKLQDLTITLDISEQGAFVVIAEVIGDRSANSPKQALYRYDIAADLGAPSITSNISFIAGLDFVCDFLDQTLISWAVKQKMIAFDGRDNYARKKRIEEELAYFQAENSREKLETYTFYAYVFADLQTRQERAVSRRKAQLRRKQSISAEGLEAELATVAQGVADRDYNDMHRRNGSLLDPVSAMESQMYDCFLDTTLLNIPEMGLAFLAHLYAHVKPGYGTTFLEGLLSYFAEREADRQEALVLEQFMARGPLPDEQSDMLSWINFAEKSQEVCLG